MCSDYQNNSLGATTSSGVWTPEQYGEFFFFLPHGRAILDRLDTAAEETQQYFWSHVKHISLPEVADAADRVIACLLKFERPHLALMVIAWTLHRVPGLVLPERIVEVLEASAQTAPGPDFDASGFRRHSAKLLDHLEKTDLPRERLARLEFQYLYLKVHKVHERYRRPSVLQDELASSPEFFVEVLQHIYKPKNGPEPEETKERIALAEVMGELLQSWKQMPGRQEDGTVNAEALRTWMVRVRELAAACERSEIANIHIGYAFAFSPPDPNGAWPHQAVRDLIEELACPEIERGLQTQVFNNRGVTTRLPTDGGEQERVLAARYDGYADQIADQWPRTAAVLRQIAENYRHRAVREDQEAELTQDLWR